MSNQSKGNLEQSIEYMRLMEEFKIFMNNPENFIDFILNCSKEQKDKFYKLTDLMLVVHQQIKYSIVNFEKLEEFNNCAKEFFDDVLLSAHQKQAQQIINNAKLKF